MRGTSKNRFEKRKSVECVGCTHFAFGKTLKADDARLDALLGGLTQQTACSSDFLSNKVFRGALWLFFPYNRIIAYYKENLVAHQATSGRVHINAQRPFGGQFSAFLRQNFLTYIKYACENFPRTAKNCLRRTSISINVNTP